jgi:pimeloyl-ACP methyl ester carboxylesterase
MTWSKILMQSTIAILVSFVFQQANYASARALPLMPQPSEYQFSFNIERVNGTTENTTQKVYMQLPSSPMGDAPVILVFHGLGYDRHWMASTGNIHLITQLHALMDEASRRGWITASIEAGGTSSAGTVNASYGNPEMDQRVTAVLNELEASFGIRNRRIYTLGYSMGGADALNYAARHQDPYDWRIAAAWSWSGVIDVAHLDGDPPFFWAAGDFASDPLPYIAASSVKTDPACISTGMLGAGYEDRRSQIFNTAVIPVMVTRADMDIRPAVCGYLTAEAFGVGGELPHLSLDSSFNSDHAAVDDFSAFDICEFFGRHRVSNTLPNRGYKTVAVEDGRYGYFDVSLANNSMEPAAFGWEFLTSGNQNALALPFPLPNALPVAGVSELRFRVDDSSGLESPLVSTQRLYIYVDETTEGLSFGLENYPLPGPSLVTLNGNSPIIWSYNANDQVVTLGPLQPGGPYLWEVEY